MEEAIKTVIGYLNKKNTSFSVEEINQINQTLASALPKEEKPKTKKK